MVCVFVWWSIIVLLCAFQGPRLAHWYHIKCLCEGCFQFLGCHWLIHWHSSLLSLFGSWIFIPNSCLYIDRCVLSSHSIHFQPHKQAACVVKKVILAVIWWWASKGGLMELWQCKDGFQSSGYPGKVCLLSLIHQRHDISLASHLAQHGTSTSAQSNPVSVVTSVSMPCPSGMPVQHSLVELLLLRFLQNRMSSTSN